MGQEATVRTGHGTVRTGHGTNDWSKTGKGCILLPSFFNLNAEYVMQNARLNESQAGIKPEEISTISDMQMIPL